MPGGLRDALTEARGSSEFVIVVVADVRGFSAFSQHQESPDVAMYIKRVYMKLIDEYFPFAVFYKATGDGLLMTIPYSEHDLQEKSQSTVDACLRCLDQFPTICQDDPMINFATPDKIGFGVGRGTACCLVSGDETLDYSGHLLNLTSRLMDLARPRGVILDGAFGLDLLREETKALFEPQLVYIRSVAEDQPRSIFSQKQAVQLSEEAKRPLRLEEWKTIEVAKTLRDWKKCGPWMVDLPRPLKRADGLVVELRHPKMRGGKAMPNVISMPRFAHYSYAVVANQARITITTAKLIEHAHSQKLRLSSNIRVLISYIPG